jgi:serine/threonine-protein kinase OSR1/STK39
MQDVAIKIISLDRFDSKRHSMEEMRKEINILSKCNHANVLKYYVSFLNQKELWLVMPLIDGGSLH